ncbi:protease B nonderepressible form [Ophidiomyces ophidiicola]|uniref:Protease B nonderepressible form n=1 Tax=Ophidiomyces ophidiicola TaxID=1387563 RepID=A0ACB8UY57_9EURO|nr:protease B nonderepressible form [Ophidiomyces ophidiicola]KAI1918658.1 protease B nonderepressible form [Ophidiomyces ophidiicola]KAI1944317.1 protease B nonderepressible form [Ophidiomyces ophidiicola]KAI1949486.1 protease B nonderepressible form [Ophidiomyces ophidiicola]KAI1972523.1 protease B nonderepressible form [Ophidiomyces ophidiicola]KAI1975522.1 protease B nonderepressible form [Ophidiomyces ophidiicola]
MKRRVSFIHDAEGDFDPKKARLGPDSITIQSLHGARQERLTFGIQELPGEIQQVVKQCHELRIRWASERAYSAVSPLTSRVSPGIHVFLSPRRNNSPQLCPLLRKAFGADVTCTTPEVSFVSNGPSKSGASSSMQFYQLLPSLDQLVVYLQAAICSEQDTECGDYASLVRSADTLDIDYNQALHSFDVTVYWSEPTRKSGWTDIVRNRNISKDKVDVGILASQEPLELDELKFGGLLAVVGRDTELKPTLFSFPSRHHPLPNSATYRSEFLSPTGLHPTLQLSIPQPGLSRPPAPSDITCGLYTYITLPSYIFADRYQLSTTDTLFLKSHNIHKLDHIAGETDLEAPDWLTQRWGSHMLVELATPPSNDKQGKNTGTHVYGDWEATIPLHLRYLHPSKSGYRNVSIPWPVVFWACVSKDTEKMKTNPFDRTRLGWDDLFGPQTYFYHLHPLPRKPMNPLELQASELVENIQVPVLRVDKNSNPVVQQARAIEYGTIAVILLGFLWILYKLGSVSNGSFNICGVSRATANKKNKSH